MLNVVDWKLRERFESTEYVTYVRNVCPQKLPYTFFSSYLPIYKDLYLEFNLKPSKTSINIPMELFHPTARTFAAKHCNHSENNGVSTYVRCFGRVWLKQRMLPCHFNTAVGAIGASPRYRSLFESGGGRQFWPYNTKLGPYWVEQPSLRAPLVRATSWNPSLHTRLLRA